MLASPGQLHTTEAERTFTSPMQLTQAPLPTLRDAEEVQLSIVVPMYNEVQRLPAMLDDALAWLEGVRAAREPLAGAAGADVPRAADESPAAAPKDGARADAAAGSVAAALTAPLRTYELVLVDDGSRDGTSDVAMAYAKQRALAPGAEIRLTRLHTNRGKGAAVRHGVLHARGAFVLFADADGATRFADLRVLAREMVRILTPEGHGIVVGSRAHLVKSEAVVKVRARLTAAELGAQPADARLPRAALGADAPAERAYARGARGARGGACGAASRAARACRGAGAAARGAGYPVRLQAVCASVGRGDLPARAHRPLDL